MRPEEYTVIDIETIPNQDMIERLPEPNVKYGNIKDEGKRQEKYDAVVQKQVDDMALSPLYGRVCCAAMITDDKTDYIIDDVCDDIMEKELIEYIIKNTMNMVVSPKICTWNGFKFDIPFLYKRALILGLETKVTLSHWVKRYTHIPHCDIAQEWCGWDINKYIKLNDVANVLLGEGKIDFDVTTIKDLIKTGEGREKVAEYCIKDAKLTQEILKKCTNILF